MSERSVAPASFQQIDLLRKLDRVPGGAARYDGLTLLQLDGRLDVPALIGAVEALAERHPALRTTMRLEGGVLSQEIHERMALPVLVSEPGAVSVEAAAYEVRANRLCGEQAPYGAPLFRAELAALGETYLLALRAHHFITDAWSDALMLRDLTELYRARVEGRAERLPALALTYADVARRQHAAWPALRSHVLEHWARQLDGYPGPIGWPRPAEAPADPYACGVITRSLDQQAAAGVRLAARDWRVPVFLVLLAATATAIGDVAGQHDLVVGSNVAQRETIEQRELIGYFTNTRLLRLRLTPNLDLGAATAAAREQWLRGDEARDVPMDQVIAELGLSVLIKIDPLELPPALATAGRLVLPDVTLSAPPESPGRYRDWRDLNVTWVAGPHGPSIELRHRLATVDQATAGAIVERALALLTHLMREETPA